MLFGGEGFDRVICGLSANDMEYSFIKAGANTFVSKPFPCKTGPLTNELRRILASKRQEDRIAVLPLCARQRHRLSDWLVRLLLFLLTLQAYYVVKDLRG
jgi:PleD family two-component response regulator